MVNLWFAKEQAYLAQVHGDEPASAETGDGMSAMAGGTVGNAGKAPAQADPEVGDEAAEPSGR